MESDRDTYTYVGCTYGPLNGTTEKRRRSSRVDFGSTIAIRHKSLKGQMLYMNKKGYITKDILNKKVFMLHSKNIVVI